jgi:hypothetical protein
MRQPRCKRRSGRADSDRPESARINTIRRFWCGSVFALAIVAVPIIAIAIGPSASGTALDVSTPGTDTNNCPAESSPCAATACAQPQAVWRDFLGDGATRDRTTRVDWTVQALHWPSFDTTILEPLSTVGAIASTSPCDLTWGRIIDAGSDHASNAGYNTSLVISSMSLSSSVGVCGCGPDAGVRFSARRPRTILLP